MKKKFIIFMLALRNYIEDNHSMLGFNILYGSKENGYFIVQDKEGYRVFLKINPNYIGVDISICHSPTKEHGEGVIYSKERKPYIKGLCLLIYDALRLARRYSKDIRQVNREVNSLI